MDKTIFIAGLQGGKGARMVSELLQRLVGRDKRIAELEAGLAEALAKLDSWTRSEYEGTSMLAAQLAEVDHLRKLLP